MENLEISLNTETLAGVLLENLNMLFFAKARTESKNLFKSIERGDDVPFLQIQTKKGHGEVNCKLALDHSEYTGALNYSKFRSCLALMLQSMAKTLEQKDKFNILRSNTGEMLFNTPGIFNNEDGNNILVFSVQQHSAGEMTIRLMYLSPDAYSVDKNDN